MKNTIYPCLWFDNNSKEAAEYYCTVFENSKIISQSPMVVIYELNGMKFMNLNGGDNFKINPSVSFFISCLDKNAVDEKWNRLSEGAKTLMPLDKYDWSERYGWLQDKYGVTWQIMLDDKAVEEKIIPSFLFTGKQFGKAEEAIKLYTSVFPASSVDTLLYYAEGDPNAGKVLYADFTLNGHKFIAMDGPGEHNYTFNEGISVVVDCKDQKEIDYYWNKLTEGGEESMCGWLRDKFGVSWQIVPVVLGKLMNDAQKGPRVVQAFMKMKKFDISALENA
jgi:predicted 3-demethylubiquinone-9 3-methyltransferase (glyoxalase superfamily)